eukprot:CAMPEP_0181168998 /NCGR_PEP_ID=MMETSP1096-20121128/579_1 /TAXON_ID=156174 ORGANISM="Chrysochromulina ericina, Strain CCMP281" /NCGR_SAMPLE_ID=MMETSP1096 /ASSEMBLY_ACC=CAM_ASM_000453 /LENGTH=112 /DNA_ID=CAMNT_0023256425 /DNA_START=1 /DNA_END=337 /DNA_ORIENTATION=+
MDPEWILNGSMCASLSWCPHDIVWLTVFVATRRVQCAGGKWVLWGVRAPPPAGVILISDQAFQPNIVQRSPVSSDIASLSSHHGHRRHRGASRQRSPRSVTRQAGLSRVMHA